MADYDLRIQTQPGYLHAIVTGRNTRENVAGYLEEIMRECEARDLFRVLIEERLEGPRLGTLDVFSIASEGSSKAIGKMRAIAYVDVLAKGSLMRFAETVAVNRALPVRVFSTIAEAEAWLTDSIRLERQGRGPAS